MPNFNKVMFMGHMTRDPEVRSLPNGKTVTEIGLASNRRYKTEDGKQHDDVTFVDVAIWGKGGEAIAQHSHKGDPLFVEGRLSFSQWEDKKGNHRSKLSVTCENFQFLKALESRDSAPKDDDSKDVKFDDVPF